MKGVQEFLQWFEGQSDVVRTITVVVAFVFLIIFARVVSRWLGGSK